MDKFKIQLTRKFECFDRGDVLTVRKIMDLEPGGRQTENRKYFLWEDPDNEYFSFIVPRFICTVIPDCYTLGGQIEDMLLRTLYEAEVNNSIHVNKLSFMQWKAFNNI